MEEQGFFDLANRAIEVVRHRYPLASFIEADGVTPGGVPASSISEISKWRFIFMEEEEDGTVIVVANGSDIGPVQFTPESWVDDRFVPWPLKMGPVEALGRIVAAGHTDKFVTVSLRWPRYPGIEQAQYIFEMEDDTYVFVGVNDGEVQVHR